MLVQILELNQINNDCVCLSCDGPENNIGKSEHRVVCEICA